MSCSGKQAGRRPARTSPLSSRSPQAQQRLEFASIDGLIIPYRPMSVEAAAGKNSRSHVGKLHNVLAYRAARGISSSAICSVRSVARSMIHGCSRFRVRLSRCGLLTRLRPRIAGLGRSHIVSVSSRRRELVEGRLLWDVQEDVPAVS